MEDFALATDASLSGFDRPKIAIVTQQTSTDSVANRKRNFDFLIDD